MTGYGKHVRGLRLDRDMSGRALCRAVGVSPSYLSDIETGRRLPAPAVSDRIAAALGVDADGLWRIALMERFSDRDRRTLVPEGAASEVESLRGQVAVLTHELELVEYATRRLGYIEDSDRLATVLADTANTASEYIAGERARAVAEYRQTPVDLAEYGDAMNARAVAEWLADPAIEALFGEFLRPSSRDNLLAALRALAAPPTAAPEADRG